MAFAGSVTRFGRQAPAYCVWREFATVLRFRYRSADTRCWVRPNICWATWNQSKWKRKTYSAHQLCLSFRQFTHWPSWASGPLFLLVMDFVLTDLPYPLASSSSYLSLGSVLGPYQGSSPTFSRPMVFRDTHFGADGDSFVGRTSERYEALDCFT